jgi:hypothetical protein
MKHYNRSMEVVFLIDFLLDSRLVQKILVIVIKYFLLFLFIDL